MNIKELTKNYEDLTYKLEVIDAAIYDAKEKSGAFTVRVFISNRSIDIAPKKETSMRLLESYREGIIAKLEPIKKKYEAIELMLNS